MKILLVHHRDRDDDSDYNPWQAWIPNDFGAEWDDNTPTGYGKTREEAIQEVFRAFATGRATWPDYQYQDSGDTTLELADVEAPDLSTIPVYSVWTKARTGQWVKQMTTANLELAQDHAKRCTSPDNQPAGWHYSEAKVLPVGEQP